MESARKKKDTPTESPDPAGVKPTPASEASEEGDERLRALESMRRAVERSIEMKRQECERILDALRRSW